MALRGLRECPTKTQARKNLVRAIESVAQRLGNTPAICKKCYIHPEIMNSYMDGTMIDTFQKRADELQKVAGLSADESAVLAFLKKRLAAEQRNRRSTLVEKLEASIRHRKHE
jgi:DNA topoisomerase-1